MKVSYRIIRHGRTYPGSSYRLVRNVMVTNAEWVHEQLGTHSEAELQAYLDNCDVRHWYAGGEHLGPDSSGLILVAIPEGWE